MVLAARSGHVAAATETTAVIVAQKSPMVGLEADGSTSRTKNVVEAVGLEAFANLGGNVFRNSTPFGASGV